MLIEVKDSSNQTIATFTYDHEGKRTSMTTASGTVNYHYSGDKVIYETDASNNIIAEYTYDPLGNPATMTKNGTTYYYHVNGHGDVVALTDGSGNTVAQYSYDAWGNIVSQSGTMAAENPLRYAGYRYDEVTGLYYLMARYYDPNIGRFITRDTFHGYEDEPLSLNQYAYTQNNPVMYSDPSGHISISSQNFGYRLKWWGHKLWFSHRFVQTLKENQLLVGSLTSASVLAPLLYLGVPGWIVTLVGAAIGASIWWFYKQDKGGGVVVEVNWRGNIRFVPAYNG